MTKEEMITKVLEEQKIIRWHSFFKKAMSKAMDLFLDQETSALRAENERLRGLINDLLVKIPMDNGNAYLSGFNESLDKLNNELNNL